MIRKTIRDKTVLIKKILLLVTTLFFCTYVIYLVQGESVSASYNFTPNPIIVPDNIQNGNLRLRIYQGDTMIPDHSIRISVDKNNNGTYDATSEFRLTDGNRTVETNISVSAGDRVELHQYLEPFAGQNPGQNIWVSYQYDYQFPHPSMCASDPGIDSCNRVMAPHSSGSHYFCGIPGHEDGMNVTSQISGLNEMLAFICWEDWRDYDYNDFAVSLDFVPGTVIYEVCGDGIWVEDVEECDNVDGFIYTNDCPYGETDCCYVAGHDNECTIHAGGYCGDGDVQEPDENCDNNLNFNWDDSLYVDVFDPSKPYCHTDIHANACRTYTPGYCGDGIEQDDHEECDLGTALNGTGRGCTVNCTDENTAWFRTWDGDVYSSGGATQSIPSGVPWNPVFSTYMCYNKTGQFTVGLGCFDQGVFESQPTSIFATNLNDDASVETKTNAEFEKIKNKIEATTDWSGFEYKRNKPNNQDFAQIVQRNYIYYFNSDFSVPVEINNNIRYSESCPNEQSCSLLIVVDGDVIIGPLVEHIDAFIIASGRIIVESSYMNE